MSARKVRQCKHCGVLKSITNFGIGREHYRCMTCAKDQQRIWESAYRNPWKRIEACTP
jgi:hypothetical protein